MSNTNQKSKTKDEYIVDFIEKFANYEYAMEPFKEGKRDLRKQFKDNNYLTAEEIRNAIRAYRLLQKDEDFDDIQKVGELLKKTIGNLGK